MTNVIRYSNAFDLILSQETEFNAVSVCGDLSFAREAQFAMQILEGNQYLQKVAMQNQSAMIAAVRNVSAIGISLNPAQKHAYLVPRGGKVVLDLSYLGLLHIATDSGSILWAQCKIVYQNDTYESTGVDTAPNHRYDPFKPRGEIVGAYCVAKVFDGSFLTEEMSIEEIHKIRARSESFKSGRMSPWLTDEGEMIKKTVLKRAFKYWTKKDRLNAAVDLLNQQDGIDFKSESQGIKELNPAPETLSQIRESLAFVGREEGAALQYFAANVFKRGVASLEDMTADEANKMLSMLKQMADAKAAKEAQEAQDF